MVWMVDMAAEHFLPAVHMGSVLGPEQDLRIVPWPFIISGGATGEPACTTVVGEGADSPGRKSLPFFGTLVAFPIDLYNPPTQIQVSYGQG